MMKRANLFGRIARSSFALRAALAYAAFGALWIAYSDRILAELVSDPATLSEMQTYKGWLFVSVTAFVLYLLLYSFVPAASEDIAPNETQASGRGWPLRLQLLGFGLVIAAPLVALLGFELHLDFDHDKRLAGDNSLHLAQAAAQNTEFFLDDAKQMLTALAQRPYVRALNRKTCDPFLDEVIKLQPRFRNVITMNRDGEFVCSSIVMRQASLARDDSGKWVNRVRDAGKLIISGTPRLGPITKRWVVPLGYPLHDARGEFVGAITMAVDLVDYPLLPTTTGLPQNTVVSIVDDAGNVIATSYDAQRLVGHNFGDSTIHRTVLDAKKSGQTEAIGADGVRRVWGFTPIQGTSWYAMAGIPSVEVYRESNAHILQSGLLAVAVLLLAALGGYALGRRIERPLRRIVATADVIAAGNRAARATAAGSREAVVLATRFNVMLDALEASEQRIRHTLDNVHLIAVALDAQGNITYCNDFLLELGGWQREELLGRNWFEAVAPDPPPGRGGFGQALAEGDIPSHYENEIVLRTGERRLIRWNNTILRDSAGQFRGTVSLGEDITERKQAQDELKRRSEELAVLNAVGKQINASLDLAHVAQTVLDESMRAVAPDLALLFLREDDKLRLLVSAGQDAVITHTDFPQHCVGACLCGLAVAQGSAVYSFDIHADPRCTQEECKQCGMRSFVALPLRSGEVTLGVLSLGSATPRDFESQATFLETIAEQAAAGLQNAMMHDRIQRHASELEQHIAERTAQLEIAKTRAEAADRVKSSFLATMSHELRTPLNSIIGFTGILLQKLPGPLNVEQEKQLGIVRTASRHLLALINDVLDISKIEAGELHIAHEPFDLRALLVRLGTTYELEAKHRGLAFYLDVGENKCMVTGDARRVEQVLINLLSNALKFTPRGDVVLSCKRGDDLSVIAVTDTGVGIKPEDMEKLFQAFVQIETGLPKVSEGTGLGLAISQHLARAMGGEIVARSEWGIGSCFTFSLPDGGDL